LFLVCEKAAIKWSFVFLIEVSLFLFSRTRAVEKLLEHLTSQEQRDRVMSALSPGAAILAKDVSGHRVILHCLKQFPREDNEVMFVHGLFSYVLYLKLHIHFLCK